MFDSPAKFVLGLMTGIALGFLLQKGRVAEDHVILGRLLLKDWTVAKVMGASVVVGSVGVYGLVEGGCASLHVKPLLFGGVLAGAVLFGVGRAVHGYCPGTTVAACGEGRRDAMAGVPGMLSGAGLFVALHLRLQPLIAALGDQGKITVPEALGVSPWPVVAALVAAGALIVWLAGVRPGGLKPVGLSGSAHCRAT